MDILHLAPGQPVREAPLQAPADGYLWIDLLRDEAADWPAQLAAVLPVEVDAAHLADSLNPQHPAYRDGAPGYDMLVFDGLGDSGGPFAPRLRPVAFFIFERLLVTVRAEANISLPRVRQRLLDGRQKPPREPFSLCLVILDAMVDRFLALRVELDEQVNALQERLLDPHAGHDWGQVLHARRALHRLSAVGEAQIDALDGLRRESGRPLTQPQLVRLRDTIEHVQRVVRHTDALEADLDSAVQLQFAFSAERTNRVMRVLTVLSAVFLPLMLITGIWGMNFAHMPELAWRWGYPAALGLLAVVGTGLYLYFKRRGFF